MGLAITFFLLGITFVWGAEKPATEVSESTKKDGVLNKVARELLLLEIEDLKKELAQGQDATSHREPPIIDSNELVEKKSNAKKEKEESQIEEIRKKLMAVLKQKSKPNKRVAVSHENEKAKRLVDLSQVKHTCVDNLGGQVCMFLSKKSNTFCSVDNYLSSNCKRTCNKCELFDAYPKYCKLLREKCQDRGIEGKFLREKCAKTCSQAASHIKACEDDPTQAEFCPMFKKTNACENRELMKDFCPKTCGYC